MARARSVWIGRWHRARRHSHRHLSLGTGYLKSGRCWPLPVYVPPLSVLMCCCAGRVQVTSVTTTDTGAPIKYAYRTELATEEYQVA